MYCRAEISRTIAVALFLTAITTDASAREFRAADTRSEDYPAVQARRCMLATKLIDGVENNWPSFVTADHSKNASYCTLTEHTMRPIEATMAPIYAKARRDPAAAQLIERIRKVD